ncbi:hypothetical protein ACG7TL_001143 [Trametes sanguinea]
MPKQPQSQRTPSVTWRQLWLDLVPETNTMDDPAPFCWEDFKAAVVDAIPIYSPRATPKNCDATKAEIEAAQAYATAYWASDDRIKFDRAAARNQHAAGRKAVIDYFHKTRATWKIQSKIDQALEDYGINLYAMAQPDLGGQIPPAERGFPLIPELIQDWFGSNVDDYESKEAAWTFFRQLLGITWQRWRKTIKRDKGSIETLEAEVERTTRKCATDDASEDDVMAHFKALRALVTKLAPYRAHSTKGKRHEEIVEELKGMEATLKQDTEAPQLKKLPKALRQALENMPSAHDAELMLARIVEVIGAAEAEGDLELQAPEPFSWAEGVEAYKMLAIADISAAFGLPSEHFPFFNKKTDNNGNEDPWTEAGREALRSPNAADLKPFWHQWVGVLKIVDNMMSGKNLMLMDQVGVGKTMQAVGTLAMYEWLRVNKEKRGHYPTRFEQAAKGSVKLPPRMHIVVCTPNLVQQWTSEIHRYLEYGVFTVLPYLGTCSPDHRKAFWQAVDAVPGGSVVIILTTYSAIKSDAQLYFKLPEKPPTTFEKAARPSLSLDPTLRDITIYSREIGVVIMDEAHTVRRPGPGQIAMAELCRRAIFAMAMTATPIVTSPMDVVLLARIIQVSGFDGEVIDMHRKALNKARNSERKDSDTIANSVAIAAGETPDNDDERPVRKALFAWVDYIRTKMADYVIRRTTSSLDREGNPIHKLHAIARVPFLVELRDDEMEVQQVLADKLQVEGAKATKKNLESFYLGIRQALLHKFAPDLEGYQFPADHLAVNYRDYPSTKIDAMLELLDHHKGKSCTPPAKVEDGHVVASTVGEDWPEWPVIASAPVDKIIVYLAFPSQNWIIRKALEEHSLEFEEIQGRSTPAQRAATLKAFQNGDKQILLMSNVGTVGLNISFANIVIIMDNLWSAQETEQLMGRVWRHPQEKKVIEYHVIADGTSDVFIGGISFDKGLAHRRLMHMPTSLQRALIGGSDNVPDEENDNGEDTRTEFSESAASDKPADRPKGPTKRLRKTKTASAPPPPSASGSASSTPSHTSRPLPPLGKTVWETIPAHQSNAEAVAELRSRYIQQLTPQQRATLQSESIPGRISLPGPMRNPTGPGVASLSTVTTGPSISSALGENTHRQSGPAHAASPIGTTISSTSSAPPLSSTSTGAPADLPLDAPRTPPDAARTPSDAPRTTSPMNVDVDDQSPTLKETDGAISTSDSSPLYKKRRPYTSPTGKGVDTSNVDNDGNDNSSSSLSSSGDETSDEDSPVEKMTERRRGGNRRQPPRDQAAALGLGPSRVADLANLPPAGGSRGNRGRGGQGGRGGPGKRGSRQK